MARKTDKRETVLVTGAAGTVGTYVVKELVAAGHRVVATDRPGCRFDFELPADAPVEIRTGDITDLSFCIDVVAGADSIIHVAAAIDLGLSEEVMNKINVEAVRYLYEAARARDCRRFVFFSSGSIYKKGGHGALTERAEVEPQTVYERSKLEAEKYLLSMKDHKPAGPEVVILRPTMIYGPRARFLGAKAATLPPVLALFFDKIPRLEGGAVCNWVHAEDVARAAVFVLDEKKAAWEIFNIADETPMSFGEVAQAMTEAYGLPLGRAVPLPTKLLELVGPAVAEHPHLLHLLSGGQERLWNYIVKRDGLEPVISGSLDRETFLYAAIEAVFDTGKLQALGFKVKYRSLREGYPGVLKWFQEHRWLPVMKGAVADKGGAGATEMELKAAAGE